MAGLVPRAAASPVSNLPTINMCIFVAVARIIHPAVPGIDASLIQFNLPRDSIRKPPIIDPTGTATTIKLAKTKKTPSVKKECKI